MLRPPDAGQDGTAPAAPHHKDIMTHSVHTRRSVMRFVSSAVGVAMAAMLVVACSGDTNKQVTGSNGAASTPSASEAPAPTGDTIIVEMITDETGSHFKPKEIEAKKGDLIRFTLTSGVHNVHFLPDSNPGKSNLPPMSDFLQLPGQTYDLVVNLAPGEYYFQCDPHALLGMVGKLEVEG
jgi:plastocyanin